MEKRGLPEKFFMTQQIAYIYSLQLYNGRQYLRKFNKE